MKRATLFAAVVTAVGIASVSEGVLYFSRVDYNASTASFATDKRSKSASRDTRVALDGTRGGAASSPTAARSIIVERGLLSLTLRNQLLGPVLSEIAGKGHLNVVSLPVVDARRVSIELHGVRLELGLQELLKDFDVFFYDSAGALKSAWIYEKDSGSQLIPVPPENWASTADVLRQMSSGSPAERISAIETLVARNGPGSSDVVDRALLDDDAEVRQRALDVGLSAGVSISRETLTSLTYDSSAPIRILALEAIAAGTPLDGPNESETDGLIRRMVTDSDAEVRAKAAELLDSRHPQN
jgi:hypothetical protein